MDLDHTNKNNVHSCSWFKECLTRDLRRCFDKLKAWKDCYPKKLFEAETTGWSFDGHSEMTPSKKASCDAENLSCLQMRCVQNAGNHNSLFKARTSCCRSRSYNRKPMLVKANIIISAGQAHIFAHKKGTVGCTRFEEVNKETASLHPKSCSVLSSHL